MKKRTTQFFLYEHRFIIGYIFLALAFFILLTFLPNIAPGGLADNEMQSAVESSSLNKNFLSEGDIINLPYHALQKVSMHLFGLSLLSIKLPSIIIAVLAGLFIILLLNRWFKNDVAVTSSILTTLSTAFLFLAGNGTPLIMYVFWLALILWLGSKIVGNDHVNPILVISFFLSVALSAYTPHLLYVALAIAIAGLLHPHLRFALKQLNFWQLFLCFGVFTLAMTPLILGCVSNPENIQTLIFMPKFSLGTFFTNISMAFAPFFSFSLVYDSVFLAPLFGLATVSLVIIGALASFSKMFTSRNTVVSLLIIYAIIVSGFNGNVAISIIIPIAVLSAAGLESIIEKWYSLFPENPYAHLFGIIPIVTVILMIIGSGLAHFVEGYHYAPRVSENFTDDMLTIKKYVKTDMPLLIEENTKNGDFYKLLAKYEHYTIIEDITDVETFATFSPNAGENHQLKQIITSPKSRNSDRLYIYSITEKEEKGE